jgi:hypothetical protein
MTTLDTLWAVITALTFPFYLIFSLIYGSIEYAMGHKVKKFQEKIFTPKGVVRAPTLSVYFRWPFVLLHRCRPTKTLIPLFENQVKRVAVIGGGCSGITSAKGAFIIFAFLATQKGFAGFL